MLLLESTLPPEIGLTLPSKPADLGDTGGKIGRPHMPGTSKTVALVNGTGRQAASVIRTLSALGYTIRAQVWSTKGLVAEELAELPGVTLFEGSLVNNPPLINALFDGAQLAFINTFPQGGDEVKIGKALADAMKKSSKFQHLIYSSMPDHSAHNPQWPALPNWACKFTVENYIRQVGLPATFVYAGIYNNNFTSLPYPLFCMDFKDDDTVEWKAPFHPDTKLPWVDAEHDVGPAILQIFKDGPSKWNGHRIALAFENLTPKQVCEAFSRALSRPCNYVFAPKIEVKVNIPMTYREQLEGIEILFGKYNAPYLPGPEFDYAALSGVGTKRKSSADDEHAEGARRNIRNSRRSNDTVGSMESARTVIESSVSQEKTRPKKLTTEARRLWAAYRGIEEYAREVFPVEEEANGKTWMTNKLVST